MASYKTGRTRTLTVTGTFIGTWILPAGLSGEPWSPLYFIANVCGITLQGSEVSYDYPTPVWGLSAAGETAYGFTNGESLDVSGTFTLNLPNVEEWADYSYDHVPASSETGAPTAADFGIFEWPPKATLKLYEIIPAGTVASVTMTGGGANLNTTYTYPTDTVVSYTPSIEAGLTIRCGDPYSASNSLDLQVDYNGVLVAGTSSATTSPTSSSTVTANNLTGAHIEVSIPVHAASGSATGARVRTEIGIPKSLNLMGANKSVDDDWPTTVKIHCPVFAGEDDSTAVFDAGASYSRSYTQRQHDTSIDLNVNMGLNGTLESDTETSIVHVDSSLNEYAAISPIVDTGWCDDNGEYIAYQVEDEGGNIANRKVYHDLVYLRGWPFNALTLAQPATFTVDDCSSATNWTGATAAGSALHNSGSAAMVRTFTPFFNFSGYRYLKLSGVSLDSGEDAVTVELGGKTWTRYKATTTPTDLLIDLCDPDTGGAAYDITDTMYPDRNPTLHYGLDDGTDDSGAGAQDGPLWGVGYAETLSITAPGGKTLTISGIEMARRTRATVHMMPEWAPRFENDMIPFGPQYSVPSASGEPTVFTTRIKRGLIAVADGLRQALELPDLLVTKTEGGASGLTFYTPSTFSIGAWVDAVNAGGFALGPSSIDTFADYVTVSNGWTAAADAPANDSSTNLHDGLLNGDAPAYWLNGNGVLYTNGAWISGVGRDATDALTLTAQLLCTSIDWYPGCGDALGIGGGGGDADAVVLAASWVSRAQAWGGLLGDDHTPLGAARVELSAGPDAYGLQTDGTVVGTDVAESVEGGYRTKGEGLIGFTAHTEPSPPNEGGGANPDTIITEPSTGTVEGVAQTFHTAHLSRVALRVLPKPDTCCDALLFDDPEAFNPLPAQAGDQEILPVEEWKR